MPTQITTPVGKIVQGELWKPQPVTDDKTGQPVLDAAGQPVTSRFFALAIPKEPGHTHWAYTAWGRQIWDEGHRSHPQFAPHAGYSWKVEDGDSQVPNKRGKKNCDRPGFPGCWILKLSTRLNIPTYTADGRATLPPENFAPGNFAQVFVDVKGNTGPSPGVYLNPTMVALAGYCRPEDLIQVTPDASVAGFGQGVALPAGAFAQPQGLAQMPAGLPAAPQMAALPGPGGLGNGLPALPGAPAGQGLPPAGGLGLPSLPGVNAGFAAGAMTSPSSLPGTPAVAVQPNPGFLMPGTAVGAVPGVQLSPPQAAGLPALPAIGTAMSPTSPQLSAAAVQAGYTLATLPAGHTVEQLKAAGYLQ